MGDPIEDLLVLLASNAGPPPRQQTSGPAPKGRAEAPPHHTLIRKHSDDIRPILKGNPHLDVRDRAEKLAVERAIVQDHTLLPEMKAWLADQAELHPDDVDGNVYDWIQSME